MHWNQQNTLLISWDYPFNVDDRNACCAVMKVLQYLYKIPPPGVLHNWKVSGVNIKNIQGCVTRNLICSDVLSCKSCTKRPKSFLLHHVSDEVNVDRLSFEPMAPWSSLCTPSNIINIGEFSIKICKEYSKDLLLLICKLTILLPFHVHCNSLDIIFKV
jgi:Tat protein secretion system quality control protein TatD with DNase activity